MKNRFIQLSAVYKGGASLFLILFLVFSPVAFNLGPVFAGDAGESDSEGGAGEAAADKADDDDFKGEGEDFAPTDDTPAPTDEDTPAPTDEDPAPEDEDNKT